MKKLKQKQITGLQLFVKSPRNADEIKRAQVVLMLNEKNGVETLRGKREGKPKELLNKKQREIIIETIANKKPKDLGYASEYWSVGLLGRWIRKRFKVEYKSKTSRSQTVLV